jgi:hypothetical protein
LLGSVLLYGPGWPSCRYWKASVISINLIFEPFVAFLTARLKPLTCCSYIEADTYFQLVHQLQEA